MKVKIFDKEVNSCNECHFLHKDPYNFKLKCSKTKKQVGDGYSIHSDCPFKTENSFTEEQFRGIGFEKREDSNFYYKEVNHGNGDIQLYALTNYKSELFSLVKYVEKEHKKIISFTATSFPHLKFILESLIKINMKHSNKPRFQGTENTC